MIKNLFVIGLLATALASIGCAQTQGFVAEVIPAVVDVVPTVEAKLGAAGIAVTVDPKMGIPKFCLDPVGLAAKLVGKIPKLGEVTKGYVGMCPEKIEKASE